MCAPINWKSGTDRQTTPQKLEGMPLYIIDGRILGILSRHTPNQRTVVFARIYDAVTLRFSGYWSILNF